MHCMLVEQVSTIVGLFLAGVTSVTSKSSCQFSAPFVPIHHMCLQKLIGITQMSTIWDKLNVNCTSVTCVLTPPMMCFCATNIKLMRIIVKS